MDNLKKHNLPESISGHIERVTFFSEETGYAVLQVKLSGRRNLVTLVCKTASVNAGEWFNASGYWVMNKDYGLQFQATEIRTIPPNSIEGIKKYLGSGLIKGIGPVYAAKMVEKFGTEIFNIIENCSARLEEIDGIGPVRRKKIKAAWEEQKAIRKIMVFLHSHGISTTKSVRIYKTYGDQSIEKVSSNPYILARDIPGIGFVSADIIAAHLGIAANSKERIKSALEYALWEATNNGHCAMPEDKLIEDTAAILNQTRAKITSNLKTKTNVDELVSPSMIASVLLEMTNKGELTEELIENENLIFLPALRNAEISIVSRIRKLISTPSILENINIANAIQWAEQKINISLSPSQRNALETILKHKFSILTGGPGVGKTTLINAFLKIIHAKHLKCILCAPTGRAAKRMSETTNTEAKTIHRLLEFQPAIGGFSRNEDRPLDCDAIIIDEVSMVDVMLMSKLLAAVPDHAKVLLVGDVDQLPSVGPGSVLKDLINSNKLPVAKLLEIFRQASDSTIITAAHQINSGKFPGQYQKSQTSHNKISDFYFIERNTPEEIIDEISTLIAGRLTSKFGFDPFKDIQVITPMNRGKLGTIELNKRIQEIINPDAPDKESVTKFGWTYRKGDKVIQNENNYEKNVFNGDIGIIQKIDQTEQLVYVSYDENTITYEYNELDELSPAYAITVHKAQGSEFPAVIIPIATQHFLLLQRNLLYTAITRGKKLVLIIGQKRAIAIAVKNSTTTKRYSGLLSRLNQLEP